MRDIELTQDVINFVLSRFPENLPATVRFSKMADFAKSTVLVDEDGEPSARTLTPTLFGLLSELKQAMAVPGRGTWITFELAVSRDGRAATRFDYDGEVDWSPSGGPMGTAYALELERYPRDAESIPSWWQHLLDNPPAEWEPTQEWIDEMDARFGKPTSGTSRSADPGDA
jgi:hypothetical protein